MANLFWVAGSSAYDGVTNRLATSTGGAATVAVINAADTVTFDANSPAAAAVTTSAAISCTTLTFAAGFTGSLTMSNGLTVSGVLTLTQGTLNTNGQTCSWGSLSSSNSNTRALNITNSAISITTGGVTVWTSNTFTGMTLTTTGSTITFSGANSTMAPGTSGGPTFNNVTFTGGGAMGINSNCTITGTLTVTATAVKTDSFYIASGSGSGSYVFNGNSVTNRLLVGGANAGGTALGPGQQRQLNLGVTGTATLTNVDFQDIKFAGTNIPATGTSVGDCGGNTNITFDAPVSQTWSGNTTGTWATAANWTSRVPLPQDNIVINGLTSGTVTINMPRSGATIDFTGSTGGILAFSSVSANFGSLIMANGMTTSGNSAWTFSGRSSYSVTTNGVSMGMTPSVNAPSGTYTFTDNFVTTAPAGSLTSLFNGTMTVLANITLPRFSFNQTHNVATVLNMGNGLWTLYGTGTIWASLITNFTFNTQGSTIITSDTSVTTKTFAGGGLVYNNLQVNGAVSAAAVTISGANTFNNITGQANAHLTLSSSTITTISSLTSQGTAGNRFVLDASTVGTAATLSSTNRIATDFLSVKDSTASGNTPFYAGANGTLVSGTTNWLAQAAPASGTPNLLLMGIG